MVTFSLHLALFIRFDLVFICMWAQKWKNSSKKKKCSVSPFYYIWLYLYGLTWSSFACGFKNEKILQKKKTKKIIVGHLFITSDSSYTVWLALHLYWWCIIMFLNIYVLLFFSLSISLCFIHFLPFFNLSGGTCSLVFA